MEATRNDDIPQKELNALANIKFSDLALLDHTIANLSKSIKTLLTTCPELEVIDPSKDYPDNQEALFMMKRPRLMIARALKQAYSKGEFELADQIAYASSSQESALNLDLNKITGLSVDLQGSVDGSNALVHMGGNEGTGNTPTESQTRNDSDTDENANKQEKANKRRRPNSDTDTDESTNQIARLGISDVRANANGEKKKWPPSLPVIHDKVLEKQVFTHKSSAYEMINYLDKKELLNIHNERLEFLGDTVLNYIASGIIYRRFPDASEGELSNIRSSLVCNDTIGEWATAYQLDKRLMTQFTLSNAKEDGGKRPKLIADVFEAFVAGVTLDSPQGLHIVGQWLAELFEPYIRSMKLSRQKQEPLNKEAKNILYAMLGSGPDYVTTEMGGSETPFAVECRYNGEVLGTGIGSNIRSAGIRAAMMALNSKKLGELSEERRRNGKVISYGTEDENRAPTTNEQNPENAPNASETSNRNAPSLLKATGASMKRTGAKDLLYSIIGSADNRPLYKTRTVNGNEFESEVSMQGEFLGKGAGKTRKEAEGAAAEDSISNNGDVVKKWSLRRSVYK